MNFILRASFTDCTDSYVISFDKDEEYTVGEFISRILKERGQKEWGTFEIHDSKYGIGYRFGNLTNINNNPMLDDDILSIPIKNVYCNGGWSRMDYCIYI